MKFINSDILGKIQHNKKYIDFVVEWEPTSTDHNPEQ